MTRFLGLAAPLPLQGHVERAFAAVMAGGVGDARDDVGEVRRGQPLGRPALEDAVALHALAGDHQDGPETFVPGARQEALQDAARPVLVEAVQVEARADLLAVAGDAVAAVGFDNPLPLAGRGQGVGVSAGTNRVDP
jgi:hypothetical protein